MVTTHKFIGFSTSAPLAGNKRQWRLFDVELIQRDLLNHFNTRVGQRIGRPTFGCRIWQYLMEQRTPDVVEQIQEEIERVVRFDPRITYEGVDLVETDRGIMATVHLSNNLTKGSWDFEINFDERQGIATRG